MSKLLRSLHPRSHRARPAVLAFEELESRTLLSAGVGKLLPAALPSPAAEVRASAVSVRVLADTPAAAVAQGRRFVARESVASVSDSQPVNHGQAVSSEHSAVKQTVAASLDLAVVTVRPAVAVVATPMREVDVMIAELPGVSSTSVSDSTTGQTADQGTSPGLQVSVTVTPSSVRLVAVPTTETTTTQAPAPSSTSGLAVTVGADQPSAPAGVAVVTAVRGTPAADANGTSGATASVAELARSVNATGTLPASQAANGQQTPVAEQAPLPGVLLTNPNASATPAPNATSPTGASETRAPGVATVLLPGKTQDTRVESGGGDNYVTSDDDVLLDLMFPELWMDAPAAAVPTDSADLDGQVTAVPPGACDACFLAGEQAVVATEALPPAAETPADDGPLGDAQAPAAGVALLLGALYAGCPAKRGTASERAKVLRLVRLN